MPNLRRISDGKGDSGSRVDAIEWNENGTFKSVKGHIPIVGCSLMVGSVTARSYSSQDYWLTTVVTEIIDYMEFDDESKFYLFKTSNSIYELYSCNYDNLKIAREKNKQYYPESESYNEYAINIIDDLVCEKVLSKSQDEAIKILNEDGIKYRVVRKDSNHYAITADFRPERLNLEIDNDIVTQVYSG